MSKLKLLFLTASVLTIPTTTKAQTMGTTLRALAENAASTASAVDSVLIAPPAAWTASSTYSAGQAVTNGGSIYVVSLGGTSGSSGGPTGRAAGEITDGS